MQKSTDFLVIGSGLAGLAYALKVSSLGKVIVICKTSAQNTNTNMAQGGIASVTAVDDTFADHIQDTLIAGAGLCHEDAVKLVVESAPERIKELANWGVKFDTEQRLDEGPAVPALTREGGHHKRRILHMQDHTGEEIQKKLYAEVLKNPNIEIWEDSLAIDLLIDQKANPHLMGPKKCIGAYVFRKKTKEIFTLKAKITVLATGGAGKVYLYTTNWEGATGDGIAMAYRAGARVANLEFMQFHPTCLYHPQERNFLVSEALRGEGAELVNAQGEAFMKKYHSLGSLAPRDIVARSIDSEMKRTGAECVYLDITHKDKDFILKHFPSIHQRCLQLGIDMCKQPIPVVPAAHYLCGGVLTDLEGKTDIGNLFAIGETACTGLHGANRLASNSLLECAVFAHTAAEWAKKNYSSVPMSPEQPRDWKYHSRNDSDEMVLIIHMWEEIRRLMWNYVGIVRSNKRLERASNRLSNIQNEIEEYYWDFQMHSDILELRNIALVAELSVRCALDRKESRGINYNIDYSKTLAVAKDTILVPGLK